MTVQTLVIGSGKAGHEANALGIAEALGRPYALVQPKPSAFFAALAPYGPADPAALRALTAGGVPALAIASGRATVPYLRALKRQRGAALFAVCLQDPRAWRGTFDLIWTPAHDKLRGANVLTTLTSPHPISPRRLATLRAAPDARLAALPGPRAALILGGPSADVAYSEADFQALAAAAEAIAGQGHSLMVTPSRRTPPKLLAMVRAALGHRPAFVWDGAGENPYAAMLALADFILVTADSANMVGEATATGAPVSVFRGAAWGRGKLEAMIDGLKALGAVRDWQGAVERFAYAPIDSSAAIAAEIRRRMAARGL